MDIVGSEVGAVVPGCSAWILRGAGTGRPAPLEPERHSIHPTMTAAVIATIATIATIAVRFVRLLLELETIFSECGLPAKSVSGRAALSSSGFSSGLLLIF